LLLLWLACCKVPFVRLCVLRLINDLGLVLDYHLLKSLKLQGQVAGAEQVALVGAEQVAMAGAVQVAAREHFVGVKLAIGQKDRGFAVSFKLSAFTLQHSAEIVTKLARTSTALAAPAAACS